MATTTTYAQNEEAADQEVFQSALKMALVQAAAAIFTEDVSTLILPDGFQPGLSDDARKQKLHEARVRLGYSVQQDATEFASKFAYSVARQMDVYYVDPTIFMASTDSGAVNDDYYSAVTGLWNAWSVQSTG